MAIRALQLLHPKRVTLCAVVASLWAWLAACASTANEPYGFLGSGAGSGDPSGTSGGGAGSGDPSGSVVSGSGSSPASGSSSGSFTAGTSNGGSGSSGGGSGSFGGSGTIVSSSGASSGTVRDAGGSGNVAASGSGSLDASSGGSIHDSSSGSPVMHRDAATPVLTGCAATVPSAILAVSCTAKACHNSTDKAYALDLQSPGVVSRLLNVASLEVPNIKLIDPSYPNNSYIWLKVSLSVPPAGVQMPQMGAKLSPSQLQCFQQWVTAEAAGPY